SDEMASVGLSDFVDGENVRMIESRGCTGLSLETLDALLVFGVVRGQHLYGNSATQPSVFCKEDLTHTASTEFTLDLVMGNQVAFERFRFIVAEKVCGYFTDGLIYELIGFVEGREQGIYLFAQVEVVTAGIFKEGDALGGLFFKRGVEDIFDLIPSFCIHGLRVGDAK